MKNTLETSFRSRRSISQLLTIAFPERNVAPRRPPCSSCGALATKPQRSGDRGRGEAHKQEVRATVKSEAIGNTDTFRQLNKLNSYAYERK